MSVVDVITSDAFLEKLALLLAAAVLTGVLVPFVKSYMDRASFEKQKSFEANLERQKKVIDAQTTFLAEFADYIWSYHSITQRVSHYKIEGDAERYRAAVQEYHANLWDLLQKIRRTLGAARWFTSDAAHAALTSWYEDWFVKLEGNIRALMNRKATKEEWLSHHITVHYEASERNFGILRFLADDYGLLKLVGSGPSSADEAIRKHMPVSPSQADDGDFSPK